MRDQSENRKESQLIEGNSIYLSCHFVSLLCISDNNVFVRFCLFDTFDLYISLTSRASDTGISLLDHFLPFDKVCIAEFLSLTIVPMEVRKSNFPPRRFRILWQADWLTDREDQREVTLPIKMFFTEHLFFNDLFLSPPKIHIFWTCSFVVVFIILQGVLEYLFFSNQTQPHLP